MILLTMNGLGQRGAPDTNEAVSNVKVITPSEEIDPTARDWQYPSTLPIQP